MTRRTLWPAVAALTLAGGAARAQDVSGRPDDLKIGGNRVSVGAGIAATPDYIGSAHTQLVPAFAAQGQIGGYAFSTQGTAASLDLVRSSGTPGWKLTLGPLAALRLDRSGHVAADAVAALGRRRRAIELGGSIGVQRTGVLTSPYDTLTFSLSAQHDVAGAHGSTVAGPEIDYDTPLSEHAFVSLALAADHAGRGFGRYYYDIDQPGSAASGLPAYAGADRAGWKDWNVSAMAVRTLSGNLMHGLGVLVTANYARLLGAYAASPIVRDAGRRSQLSGAIGLEYGF